MSEQPSCKQRIRKHYRSTVKDIRKLWRAYLAGEEEVEDLGSIYDYGLGFDYVAANTFPNQDKGYFRWQLSWGGPSSEFRFYPDAASLWGHRQRGLPYVEYWFLDWGDGAHLEVKGDDRILLGELWDWFAEISDLQGMVEEACQV